MVGRGGEVSPASVVRFAVVVAAFFGPLRPRPDPDTWWHLATGRWILDHEVVPRADPFSWTAAGREWIPHEWLSQTILAAVDHVAGPQGLLVLAGLCVGFAFLLLDRALASVAVSDWARAATLALTLYLSIPLWTLRPHLLTLLFFSIELYVLIGSRDRIERRLWLVPLFAVWANLHGGFVAGLLLLGLFVGEAVVRRPAAAKAQVALLMAAVAATLLNPSGIRVLVHPLTVAQVSEPIHEWAPTDLRDPFGIAFALAVFTPLVVAASTHGRSDATLLVSAAVFGALGFGTYKSLSIAALAIAPAFAVSVDRLLRVPHVMSAPSSPLRLVQVSVLALALYFAGTTLTRSEAHLRGETEYPRRAAEALDAMPTGRLMNPYAWGGYLIWRSPELAVAIDGRNDMYGERLLEQMLDVEGVRPGWRDFLVDHNVSYVLTRNPSPLAEVLRVDPEWRIGHEDPLATIFVRL